MSTVISPVTAEDLLKMPEDGIDRELIRGEVREKPMTYRGHLHSVLTSQITQLLLTWLKHQPTMRGAILSGEAAVRLCRDPETTVGIDIALFSAEVLERTPPGQFFTEGPPILAVEVLSPSDKTDDIADKVQLYLEYGVAVVWTVNPRFQIITAHRPNAAPQSFNILDDLVCEPELPGFRVPMKEIFELVVGGQPT